MIISGLTRLEDLRAVAALPGTTGSSGVNHVLIRQLVEAVDAFAFLMQDVEDIDCIESQWGFPVEDEQHPFHDSVLRARAALKPFQGPRSGP